MSKASEIPSLDLVPYLHSPIRDEGIHSELELETLERYPSVLENLKRRGILLALPSGTPGD